MSGLILMTMLYIGVAIYSLYDLMHNDVSLKDVGVIGGVLLIVAVALVKYFIELGAS